jgi:hypothetical protein
MALSQPQRAHRWLSAGIVANALSGCLISPKDYPLGELDDNGRGGDPGRRKGAKQPSRRAGPR